VPTIGVSIAVPDPEGRDLQDYRIALGDETARHIPTHITLVPPTEIDEADLDSVSAHLQAAAAKQEPYRVSLRGTGTFRPVSPVVFVGVVEGIAGCELLADSIRTGPLAVEANFPYHPHVTIAHDLPGEVLRRAFDDMAPYDVRFQVWGFSLYEHGPDRVWRPQRDFPLGRPLPGPAPRDV